MTENNSLLKPLFCTTLLEELPDPVRKTPENVMGISIKSSEEFCEHVVNEVEKHKRNEEKLTDQERELQRKDAQLQLSGKNR